MALLESGNASGALPYVKAVLIKFPPESIRARRLQVSQCVGGWVGGWVGGVRG